MLFWRKRPHTLGLTVAAATSLLSLGAAGPARADAAATPAAVEAPKPGAAPVERPARAGATELTWLGHAAWMLRSPQGTTVLIDPWLTNPKAPQDFALPSRVDAILVTHGHADHLGEAAALSRRFGAPVVGAYELIELLGLENGIGGNPGGTVQLADLKVHLTQAVHSSSVAPQPPAKPHAGCGCNHGAPAAGAPTEPAQPSAPSGEASGEAAVPSKQEGTLLARELGAKQADGARGHACGGKNCSGPGCHGKDCATKACKGGKGCSGHGAKDASHAGGPMRPAPAGENESPLAHGELPADAAAPAPHVCAGHGGHGGQAASPTSLYAGAALGFVIEVEDGPTLYHAGDTDVFADMRLIARRYRPEVALLPIGDHYTMGPKDAALATRLLGVKEVLPMHYGTFPLLKGTPEALREALGNDARVVVPRPGGKVSFVGRGDG